MSNHKAVIGLLLATGLFAVGASASRAAETAQDVLAKSIQAHGGDKLTTWKTMVVEGTIEMQDGIAYHAAYRLWAKMPGKLRVEHDLTADRGRRFDQYFLNGGVSWMRRNLIVGTVPPARMQGWLDQCAGVARYAKHGAAFTLQPDAVVQWQVPADPGSNTLKVVESRPAWVLRATIDGAQVELHIDKERFFLLQEVTPGRAPRVLGIHQLRRPDAADEDQRVREDAPGRNAHADHLEIGEVRRRRSKTGCSTRTSPFAEAAVS